MGYLCNQRARQHLVPHGCPAGLSFALAHRDHFQILEDALQPAQNCDRFGNTGRGAYFGKAPCHLPFYNMMGWLDLMYFKPLSILKCAQFFTMLLKMSMNGPGFKTLSLEPIAIHLELETRKRPQYSPVHRLLT